VELPIRRPVATAMVFVAVVILGIVGWVRLPVELIPPLQGNELHVAFARPGSDPEVVERELLTPLEARLGALVGVEESWGEIRGSSGSLRVRFEAGTDLKVRELELRSIAADLVRTQPEGTVAEVSARDLSVVSRFVMAVELSGVADRNALRTVAEEQIVPHLSAVPGVAQVLIGGGAPREVTVRLDPDRAAALGVSPTQVSATLARQVQRLRYVGSAETAHERWPVLVDGRPQGVHTLGEIRVGGASGVLLRHVAQVELGTGEEERLFRVNGRPSLGLIVFQEEGANLVRLGRALRDRVAGLDAELATLGVGLEPSWDAAEVVEEQLGRLKQLGLTGFLIALVVLYLFIRSLRAVAVVAVAVPVSLLAAVALLYVFGQSLNLISLFGLAVGIGMLVDNSIVVFEAVQRQLERGVEPDRATVTGVRRTVRAIAAATATTAVVFLPVVFIEMEQGVTRELLEVMAVAILLPLVASLGVAVGLVPLLARHLAAPAAEARVREERRQRRAAADLRPPDRSRELFGGVLAVALRRPGGWLAGIVVAIFFTVLIAVPWVSVTTVAQEAGTADEVRMALDLPRGASLEAAGEIVDRIESPVLGRAGVERVETVVQEGSGSLTVRLAEDRPPDLSAGRVRQLIRAAVDEEPGVDLRTETSGAGGGGEGLAGLLGQSPAEVIISGPNAEQLLDVAAEIEARLESVDEVAEAWSSSRTGQRELWVIPDARRLAAWGLTADSVLPALGVLRREGVTLRTGLTLPNGEEIPLTVRTVERDAEHAVAELAELKLATPAGVLPLAAVGEVRRMPPPPVIVHHNGRRELSVSYRLGSAAPTTGPARQELDAELRDLVRDVHRPAGVVLETTEEDAARSWFKTVLLPVLLLLLAVLAITFESLTVPVLVLLAVPLTVLGATWALVIAGLGADQMALVGAVALLGLTVNPAILLVDRMQQRVRRGAWTAGGAALAAVRERARPVLMTTCTTVAGLWPLALSTGRENEIWPPFATVVMGGLVTSTVLTLLVVPVGFVVLRRLDVTFGRLGPWVVLAWLAATTAVIAPLVLTDTITSLTWQVVTTVLVGAALLALAALVLYRRELPEPVTEGDGPPSVEARFLRKIYGQAGPIGRAWRAPERFAERVLRRGGTPFDLTRARRSVVTWAVVAVAGGVLTASVDSVLWRPWLALLVAWAAGRGVVELRRARGRVDERGRALPGGVEPLLAALAPWLALAWLGWSQHLLPRLEGGRIELTVTAWVMLTIVVAIVQLGRWTAVRVARGELAERVDAGWLRTLRTLWRRLARLVLGGDLPREEVEGLATVSFRADRGMVGILGPNGAGKTTLLRLLAGILEPSSGAMLLGGVHVKRLRRYLARWVGYLPQEFGLPDDMTAREYLAYYAVLYELPEADRRPRVNQLLEEVGLGERADATIGSFSGGMRQRVAVARTLLRLPPVIIVDEPTVGLDPRERIRFRNLLARLAEGRVVLFSTHVVEDVAVACERVLVLARGALVFDGPPERLAEVADGKVWEVRSSDETLELADGARVVDRVPAGDGGIVARVLATASPHPQANQVAPTLEDGYLLLVRTSGDGGERALA
jgi:multidrug efflux pump subunit AcrB/ABC-type multidrug transport system ATPase subunit